MNDRPRAVSRETLRVLVEGKLVDLVVCGDCGSLVADETAHARFHKRTRERDDYIKAFNAIENAVSHHRRDKATFADDVDDRLYRARDTALRRLAGLVK